jgi:hypothetical protein
MIISQKPFDRLADLLFGKPDRFGKQKLTFSHETFQGINQATTAPLSHSIILIAIG